MSRDWTSEQESMGIRSARDFPARTKSSTAPRNQGALQRTLWDIRVTTGEVGKGQPSCAGDFSPLLRIWEVIHVLSKS